MDHPEDVLHKATITVVHEQGLTGRAAVSFVEAVKRFSARLIIWKNGRAWDGSSITHLVMLGAHPGDRLILEADGADGDQQIDALCELLTEGLDTPNPDHQKHPIATVEDDWTEPRGGNKRSGKQKSAMTASPTF